MKQETWIWIAIGAGALLLLASITKPIQKAAETAVSTVEAWFDRFRTLIQNFEGLSLTVYQDQAGKWTIGFGHLIVPGDRYFPYGPVKEITLQEALDQLNIDTQVAQKCVSDHVATDLTDGQRAALVSFVFNTGCEAFTQSTILQDVNAGNFDAAASEFDRWNHVHDPATGKLIASAGLTNRRAAERALFEQVA